MDIISLFTSLPPMTIVIILIIFGIWVYFFFIKFNARTVSNAPTVLTSIGIFGTFFGIALGLSDFNTEDIQGSVPTLIDGLKTAFWSSVAGIFFALLIKIRHLYQISNMKYSNESHGATIDDIVNQLRDVNKALVGEEESTLLSQMKLIRQDSNDKLDGLKRAMEDFIKDMAENNSKALIEALKEVIRDFNAKINEQFGENFKELNQAVGKLLDWQERYRLQMEKLIIQQETTANIMATATEDYKKIVDNSSKFSDVADKLSKTINFLDEQREPIHNSIKELAILIDSAKTGLPEIESKITALVEQVTDNVKNNSKTMEEAINSAASHMEKAINSAANNLDNLLSQSNERFNTHIDKITEQTRKQVNELDQALSEELTKSLESLGQQLASLSEKFVNDYKPLTEKLQKIVNISKNVSL
jgi:ABC-type transporter Mla subunit MlaD